MRLNTIGGSSRRFGVILVVPCVLFSFRFYVIEAKVTNYEVKHNWGFF